MRITQYPQYQLHPSDTAAMGAAGAAHVFTTVVMVRNHTRMLQVVSGAAAQDEIHTTALYCLQAPVL